VGAKGAGMPDTAEAGAGRWDTGGLGIGAAASTRPSEGGDTGWAGCGAGPAAASPGAAGSAVTRAAAVVVAITAARIVSADRGGGTKGSSE
jgi:hypothetical protein